MNGHINSVFIIEKWNPKNPETLERFIKIDYRLYKKIFRKITLDVGASILKYRTTVNSPVNRGNFFKNGLVLRNYIKYSLCKIKNQTIDEKLFIKLSSGNMKKGKNN